MKAVKLALISGVALLFAVAFVPSVFALQGLTVNGMSNPQIAPGSTVSLNNVFGGLAGETDHFNWIGVVTPNGNTYILEASVTFTGGASGGSVTCNVPFGGSGGSLSVSGQSGTAGVTGCSGTASWWQTTSPQSLASLSLACNTSPNSPPSTTGSATNGDTSQHGQYHVMACYNSTILGGSFNSADQVFTTPQFGLGLGVAVAAAMMGLLLVKRRAFNFPTVTKSI